METTLCNIGILNHLEPPTIFWSVLYLNMESTTFLQLQHIKWKVPTVYNSLVSVIPTYV